MMSPPAKVAMAVSRLAAALLAVAVLGTGTAAACVGVECLLTWSTEDGGGALTLQYNFATSKVQTSGPSALPAAVSTAPSTPAS